MFSRKLQKRTRRRKNLKKNEKEYWLFFIEVIKK